MRRFRAEKLRRLNDYKFTKEKYKVVYLMVGEDPYNALKGDIPVKIGISNKVDKRKAEIKSSLKEKVVHVDGVKQSISITNPEIFCTTIALPYAEAVEKAAQAKLCQTLLDKYNESAKIAGYNDWFKTKNLFHAMIALLQGIEEVEGDIDLKDGYGNYLLLLSETYNKNHEFHEEMFTLSSNIGAVFSLMNGPTKSGLSDKATLKRTKKKYLIRDAIDEDFELWNIPEHRRDENWRTLVLPIRNYANKKQTARLRIPVLADELINFRPNVDVEKLKSLDILSLLIYSSDKYMDGIGCIDIKRRAFLSGTPRLTEKKLDGTFEFLNQIELRPHEWWQLIQAN